MEIEADVQNDENRRLSNGAASFRPAREIGWRKRTYRQ
jgi:hypothetical protein